MANRFKYPKASLFVATGMLIVMLDQGVLWALQAGVEARVWGVVRTAAVVVFFSYLFRREYRRTIHEIERNRKRLAIGLSKQRQRAEQLTMAGTLAAAIAHEIRNPLTSLRGFIQLSQSNKQANYADIMLMEIDRINDIVNELLVLAKPQKGDFARQAFKPLLQNVITLLNPQAILNNVQLIESYAPQLESLTMVCVENKLKQVFINVIKNAIEAMPGGGDVVIVVTAEEDSVTIEIADGGPGFPLEQLDQIGEPFHSTKEKGTGLGLMICQTIVEEHRGTMQFLNRDTGGALVRIKLPLNQ
jgi:two-component system, sporulation sensor kinase C